MLKKVVNFHEGLEKDLTRLSAEIRNQKEKPETRELLEREVVKRSLEAIGKSVQEEAAQESGISTGEEKRSGNEDQSSIFPAYLEKMPEPQVQQEVERLIDSVFQHGVERALKESKRLPPFVQDAFHDSLVDRLLPELKKRGLIS